MKKRCSVINLVGYLYKMAFQSKLKNYAKAIIGYSSKCSLTLELWYSKPAEYVGDTSQAVDMQPAIPDKQEEQNGGQPLGKGKENSNRAKTD